MRELIRRYGITLSTVMVTLTALWLLFLLILPDVWLFEQSFRPSLPVTEIGGPKDFYSFNNYLTVLNTPVPLNFWGLQLPVHVLTFIQTILISSLVTFVCFVLAYPIAYFLAKVADPKNVATLFLLLLIPLWVSEILRSFSWFIILSFKGPLNMALISLGIMQDPIRWLTGYWGVIFGLIYVYILFMLFPIYNAVQSLDSNQIEAAQDLGSPWWRTHWRVILPHSKPGIASGCVMVFMLSAGSVIVPQLLASPSSPWFTLVIQSWMFESLDWNTGSAYAFMLLLVCIVFVSLVMRAFRVSLAEIAK
jgi:spermidine/putrescine transport system permease protein